MTVAKHDDRIIGSVSCHIDDDDATNKGTMVLFCLTAKLCKKIVLRRKGIGNSALGQDDQLTMPALLYQLVIAL